LALSFSTLPETTSETNVIPAEPAPGKSLLREILETVLLTVLIYLAVNFATGRFRIEGSSMEPSMHPNQYVLVDKVSYKWGNPHRGDVVVFNYPLATERDFIKRVIGLPGETVSVHNGVISIDGQPLDEPYIAAPPTYENSWTLGPNQYFVLGDNRNSSSDSHSWGPLDRHYLIGRAIFVYWPPTLWGTVPLYTYADAPERTAQPVATASPSPGQNGYPAYP
jgi:signal peptidase I